MNVKTTVESYYSGRITSNDAIVSILLNLTSQDGVNELNDIGEELQEAMKKYLQNYDLSNRSTGKSPNLKQVTTAREYFNLAGEN